MSRGFVKEGDQEEPIIIPPRAVLPDGQLNYVTPKGFEELQAELKELESNLLNLHHENETDLRRTQQILHGKIKLLKERMASARILDPKEQSQDEVRFGCTVTFKNHALKNKQIIRIVGVDEAQVEQGKIAFTTPIARALAGAKVGDVVDFKLGDEIRKLEILSIDY